jgi:acetate kinase
VGTTGARFRVNSEVTSLPVTATTYKGGIDFLIGRPGGYISFSGVKAIGHLIVQGMQHTVPGKITAELLYDLKNISTYHPDHLHNKIQLIKAFKKIITASKQARKGSI